MTSWVAVLGCFAVACADVPTPLAYSGPEVNVATDDAGLTHVIAPSFALTFAATGPRLPVFLDANGKTYLGKDPGCAADNLIGFSVSPAIAVAGDASVTSSTLSVIDGGPGVVKVRVAFSVPYSCPTATAFTGSSDFTIFPSGRIVREDNLTPTSQPLAPSETCGCAATQQNFTVSANWTFDGVGATQLQPDNSPAAADAYRTCTMYDANTPGIGVSFANISGDHTRYHTGVTSTHAIDFYADAATLSNDAKPMTSAIQIGFAHETCQELIVPLLDVPLQIGSEVYMYTDHDGIYRDIAGGAHTTAFDLVATTKPVPPGFAISVDLGGADHATITRVPDLGTTVGVPQHEIDTHYLIYFPDGLAVGETINITPQP